jgi:hypothetical protein
MAPFRHAQRVFLSTVPGSGCCGTTLPSEDIGTGGFPRPLTSSFVLRLARTDPPGAGAVNRLLAGKIRGTHVAARAGSVSDDEASIADASG